MPLATLQFGLMGLLLLMDERVLVVRNESAVAVRGLVAELDGSEKRIPPVAPRGSVVVRVPRSTEKPWVIFRIRDSKRERLGSCGQLGAVPERPTWSVLRLVSPAAGSASDCVLVMSSDRWRAAQR